MRALAIDTSTAMAGIAVVDESGLLAQYMIRDKKTHSQKLVPMLRELIDSLGIVPAEIDVFAAVTGPGSFTGLRIGVTTVKSLAYALQKPTVGVTSLDALAHAAASSGDTMVCPIMDARNNQVYTALYKLQNGVMVNVSGYMGVHVSELVKLMDEKFNDTMNSNGTAGDLKVLFTGDGVSLHRDFLSIELNGRCAFAPDFLLQQMAASAAQLALTMAKRGETMDSFELEPFYLRPSQAEREYARKHAGEDNGAGNTDAGRKCYADGNTDACTKYDGGGL